MNVMVILNYNDADTTITYLNQIKNYSVLDKIIVVDNCSTDNSYERIVRLKNEKIDVILSKGNFGYAAGNNVGIAYANSHYDPAYIIVSNPDIEVEEAGIEQLICYLEKNRDVAVATGLIHNGEQQVVRNFAWKLPDFRAVLRGNSGIIHSLYEKKGSRSAYYSLKDAKEGVLNVDVVPGCFFVIRNSAWEMMQGFDERTFLFWEENIMSYTLREKNLKVCVLPDIRILHKESASISKNIKSYYRKKRITFQSESVYVRSYLKKGFLARVLHRIVYMYGLFEGYLYMKYSAWKRRK